jgi:hypothetical protein
VSGFVLENANRRAFVSTGGPLHAFFAIGGPILENDAWRSAAGAQSQGEDRKMQRLRWRRAFVTALSFGGLGALAMAQLTACRPQQTEIAPLPPPPKAPPEPEKPKVVTEAPKPKCESLEEKCAGAADSQLDVGAKGAWFKPPVGWSYAREADRSVALSPDGNASLAMTSAAGAGPDEIAAATEALLTRLEVTKVKLKDLKKRFKEPESTLSVDGQEVRLWEVDKKKQGGQNPEMKTKPGVVLVVAAPFADQPIVGVGFVVKPEGEAQAAIVMEAVQTLRAKK